MSLIELWQRPPKSIPEPSYVHVMKGEWPEGELTKQEQWQERYYRLKAGDAYDRTDRWTSW